MKNNSSDIRFFGANKMLPFLRTYRRPLLTMIICGLAGSLVGIVEPLFQRYSLNHFIALKTLDTLPLFILIYLFIVISNAVCNYIACTYATSIEVWLDRDLRNKAFSHLQTLAFSYYNQNSVGYIHSRIMSDTGRIGTTYSWLLMEGTWQITYLVGSIAVMFSIQPRLATLVVLVIPVIVVIFSVFQKRLVDINHQVRECNSQITGSFNEGITGAKTVKTLVVEETVNKDFQNQTAAMKKKGVTASKWRSSFASVTYFASSLALALVLWQGGYIVEDEIGTYSMFMTYAQGLMTPVRWLIDVVSELITCRVNVERLFKLLETKSDVTDTEAVIEQYGDIFSPKRENWEPIRGDIEFRDVSFHYPDGEESVLEHFNLQIPFGTNLAIVGETGAGKSTLASLICRFYEPTEGAVLIDGRDARERSQLWLHSAIGYVLQTPHLFSGTIRENLLYGNQTGTDEEIWDALRLVSADEIVNKLADGLDTDVGEGGDLLSTGEKQLLCFARAILADPRILILDEATASVDTITEKKIQSAIDTIIRGRTSVVIAHRLSTVRNADRILVVKNGKIIEQGKHTELMQAKGYYYSLYTRQYEDEATGAVFHNSSDPVLK